MGSRAAQLDSTIRIVTPENIAFQYEVAGPFRRLPAFLADLLIRAAVMSAIWLLAALLMPFVRLMPVGVVLVIWFMAEWLYGGVFETMMNGQTPGKWMFGIRVLTVDGQPINGLQAMLRNLLRFVDMFPPMMIMDNGTTVGMFPLFTVGLVTMACTKRFQRMGDIVCQTMVVVEQRQRQRSVVTLEDPRTAKLAELIPKSFVISRSLARTLATYTERRRQLSPARRREVARHLGDPLIERLGLLPDTSHDLLLCALYHRAFVAAADLEDPFGEFGGAGEAVVARGSAGPHAVPPASGSPAWRGAATPLAPVDPNSAQVRSATVPLARALPSVPPVPPSGPTGFASGPTGSASRSGSPANGDANRGPGAPPGTAPGEASP